MTDFIFTLEPDEEPEPEPEVEVGSLVFTTANFLGQLQALLPPGKLWTRAADALLTKLLNGIAPEFARVQARADQLLLEMSPGTAVEMLDEHEQINGLPDPCAEPPTTTEARQAALLARLRDNLGHNPEDYVQVAETLGHIGTTVHRRPYPPARAGIARAGFPAYSDAWAFMYTVAYMENLIAGGAWTLSNAVLEASDAFAPDDGADADRIDFAASGTATKTLSGLPTSAQFEVWLRVPTGDGTATVTLELHRAGPTLVASETITVTENWTRYVLRGEHASGLTHVRLSAEGPDVIVWDARVGAVDDVLECRFDKIQQSHTVAEFRVIGSYVQPLE